MNISVRKKKKEIEYIFFEYANVSYFILFFFVFIN